MNKLKTNENDQNNFHKINRRPLIFRVVERVREPQDDLFNHIHALYSF